MSDNDSITNSNGLVGGWTHLIPEECAVESVGPGDGGNESLAETPSPCEKVTCSVAAPETGGGVPPRGGADSEEWPHGTPASPEAPVESVGPEDDGRRSPAEATNLSEEVTGPVAEEEPGDGGVPPEAALSEEGLQVCQETTSESSTPSSPTVSSPSPSSHVPLISDQEGHTPFGLDTDPYAVTSPCSDTDGLIPDSTTTDAYTHISSATEIFAADSPAPDAYTHISSAPEIFAADSPAHDTVIHTSSAPENLAADGSAHDTDTHISSAPELLAPDSPSPDTFTHVSPAPESYPDITPEPFAPASSAPETYTDVSPEPFAPANSAPESYPDITPEPFAPASSAPETYTDVSPEPFAPANSAPESYPDITPEPFAPASSAPETYTDVSPAFESQSPGSIPSASVLESQEGEEPEKEEEVSEPAKILAEVVPQEDFRGDSDPDAPSYEGDGLRRRHASPPGPPEPLRRVREEEEEEDEEEEFHLIVKKEERGGISLNKCIVGALVLLCLGSIIYTGYVLDLDGEEDSAQPEVHGKQERLNPDAKLPDPKEVAQLLGKLAEDNQQVAILQAQLQTQKDELDMVLQKAEEMVKEPPAGQTENHTTAHRRLWEGQNEPASEEGDTGQEGEKTGVAEVEVEREEVEEERSGRTERAEKPVGSDGERKRQWEGRVREVRREARQEKEWKKGREQGKERRQREERKEKKGERDWKLGKDKHREWKEKVERRRAWEKGRESYKGGERKREGAWKGKTEKRDQRQDRWRGEKKEKDWKAQKEGWKAREERGMGKDKSKKEKHWQSPAEKKPRALDHADYWKHQQEKLGKNRPPVDCKGVADCARKEGLVPVKEAEFRGLLTSYLGKLGDDDGGASKGAVVSLVGEFFADGVFAHHRVPFREFVEDVADVLEDVAEGDRRLEEEMEEFEKEALRRFAVAGGGEREGRRRGKDGRMWG